MDGEVCFYFPILLPWIEAVRGLIRPGRVSLASFGAVVMRGGPFWVPLFWWTRPLSLSVFSSAC